MKISKYQNPSGPVPTYELKPSQAIKYNNSSDKAVFFIPYGGTPYDPEFLSPEELEASVVTADKSISERNKIDQQVSKMMSNDGWYTRSVGEQTTSNPSFWTTDPKTGQSIPTRAQQLFNEIKRQGTRVIDTLKDPYYTIGGVLHRKGLIGDWWDSNLSFDPTVVDMTTGAYTTNYDDDTYGVDLFNEMTEMINPNIYPAHYWRTKHPDYLLGDNYNIPLKNISLFQGVEDEGYRLMPLDQFNPNTTVAPIRMGGVTRPKLMEATWSNGHPSYKFDDGGTEFPSYGDVSKFTIGNENGGMFVNKPSQLDSTQVVQLNELLQKIGPAYVAGQDSGSNGHYETQPGINYSNQGVGYNQQNTLIFGKKVK